MQSREEDGCSLSPDSDSVTWLSERMTWVWEGRRIVGY